MPGTQSDLFQSPHSGDAGMLALVELIRAQTVEMQRANEKMERVSSAVAQVREDIAVLKAEAHRDAELATEVAALKEKIAALELRNAQQDGGMKLATFFKDFSPWVVAILASVFAYFKE